MKLLNFDSGKPKNDKDPKKDKAPKEKPRAKGEGGALAFETNNPEDVVTGKEKKVKETNETIPGGQLAQKEDVLPADALPWANSTYNVEPGHGLALVDVLRRVATDVKKLIEGKRSNDGPAGASAELNWDQAFAIIKNVFKQSNIKLVEFKDREKHEAVPYYLRNTPDGMFFWISPRDHAEAALNEAVKQLQANGMTAVRRESGILLQSANPNSQVFTPEEVAHYSKGENIPLKSGYALELKGKLFHYDYDENNHSLSIHCSKGPIKTSTVFVMQHANSKQIARTLRYQAERYTRMFHPETFGLVGAAAPFKLKKHIITYCSNGQSLVISPEDGAYLITDKGDSLLCRHEGKLGLNPDLTFKQVTNSTKFIYGDIWCKFGHLLAKRGLLI